MPILIGNNLFIEELPVDYNGKLLDLDPYIAPLNAFFDKLEVECVRECCGIEAFSFMTVEYGLFAGGNLCFCLVNFST